MDAIYIENLHKSFGPTNALKGLSMSVKPGTVCGLIGPNGAGKTTTIRILLGLVPKDKGKVQLFGHEVVFGKELGIKGKIAYLPQDPVFPEKHTAEEVMDLVGRLYGMDKKFLRVRAEMLLKEFHLDHVKKKNVTTFSRGMKQRLGLATCFLPEPELLILDEPVSALDPEGRVEVFDLLQKLKGKATVLFSSHILDDVERISDTLVTLKRGQKVIQSPMNEVLRRYAPDRIKIRFEQKDVEHAISVLSKLPWVTNVSKNKEPDVLYAHVNSTQMDTALKETLVHLINQGFKVLEYGRSRADLETVFLRFNS